MKTAREPASATGENPISVADAEHRDRVLAKARDILARQPTAAEIEEDELRRQRLTVATAMPDLATLQTKWLSGDFMSDAHFYEMRRLEALARIAPPAPPKPATIVREAPTGRLANAKLLDRARKAELEIKLKAGGRWTDQERAEWWVIHGTEICERTDRLVDKNRVGDAIALLVKEFAVVAFSQSRNRERLEDRVARLEKPRYRVPARQETI